MVLKLYGNPQSTCTRRVALVAKHANIPYEFVLVDFSKGEHKCPAFVEKQPFGQVPYLDDDGFILYESRAIARYILTKGADTSLYPTDSKARALVEQAISVEEHNFNPFVAQIIFQRIWTHFFGGKTDEARVQENVATLAQKLEAYERILSKQKYLAGDELSLADLFHVPYGVKLGPQGINLLSDSEKYPNVARWWKELTKLQSWKAVVAEYGDQ